MEALLFVYGFYSIIRIACLLRFVSILFFWSSPVNCLIDKESVRIFFIETLCVKKIAHKKVGMK